MRATEAASRPGTNVFTCTSTSSTEVRGEKNQDRLLQNQFTSSKTHHSCDEYFLSAVIVMFISMDPEWCSSRFITCIVSHYLINKEVGCASWSNWESGESKGIWVQPETNLSSFNRFKKMNCCWWWLNFTFNSNVIYISVNNVCCKWSNEGRKVC